MKRNIVIVLGALASAVLALCFAFGAPTRATDSESDQGTTVASTEPLAVQHVAAETIAPEAREALAAATAAARAAPTPEERKAAKEKRRQLEAQLPFHWERDAERNAELDADRRDLGSRWSGEPSDRAWTSETAERIAVILHGKQLDPSAVKEVDCRRTICRFALTSPSPKHGDVMATISAAREIDPETWTMPDAQANGSYNVDVFFPRKGYRLSGGGGRIDEPMRVQ